MLETNDLFKDIIKSPEKNFDQENALENYIESKYYSVKKTGTLIDRSRIKNVFSILHCNMQSLPKNILLLEELLCSLRETPNIIAVSETKLKENNLYNITLEGYTFLASNSKTSAGGVGLYVDKQLDFVQRKGLEIILEGVESCWIEIENKKQKTLQLAVSIDIRIMIVIFFMNS